MSFPVSRNIETRTISSKQAINIFRFMNNISIKHSSSANWKPKDPNLFSFFNKDEKSMIYCNADFVSSSDVLDGLFSTFKEMKFKNPNYSENFLFLTSYNQEEIKEEIHEEMNEDFLLHFKFENNIVGDDLKVNYPNHFDNVIIDLYDDMIRDQFLQVPRCELTESSFSSFFENSLIPYTTPKNMKMLLELYTEYNVDKKIIDYIKSLLYFPRKIANNDYFELTSFFLNLVLWLKFDGDMILTFQRNLSDIIHHITFKSFPCNDLNMKDKYDIELDLIFTEWDLFLKELNEEIDNNIHVFIESLKILKQSMKINSPLTLRKKENEITFIEQLYPQNIILNAFKNKNILILCPDSRLIQKFMIDINLFKIVMINRQNILIPESLLKHQIYNFASILLNPENEMFNFFYTNFSNKIIKRNNVMYHLKQDNLHKQFITEGYVILKYYPAIYNYLQDYCSDNCYRSLHIKGSTGTGKRTMLIYIVLRWYQKSDLWNNKGDRINTLIISENEKENNDQNLLYFFKRIDDNTLQFGTFITKDDLYDIENIIPNYVIELSSNPKTLTEIPEESLINYSFQIDEKTLFLLNHSSVDTIDDSYKLMIINDLGGKYSLPDYFIPVFTLLPTDQEMHNISLILTDQTKRNNFESIYQYVGSNIDVCLNKKFDEEFLENIHKAILSVLSDNTNIEPNTFLDIHSHKYRNYIIRASHVYDVTRYYSIAQYQRWFSFIYLHFSTKLIEEKVIEAAQKINTKTQFTQNKIRSQSQYLKQLTFQNVLWKDINHRIFKGSDSIMYLSREFYFNTVFHIRDPNTNEVIQSPQIAEKVTIYKNKNNPIFHLIKNGKQIPNIKINDISEISSLPYKKVYIELNKMKFDYLHYGIDSLLIYYV